VSTLERAVAGHYDALDGWYRELWGEHLHHGLWDEPGDTVERATERLVDLVAAEARITPGDRVLDAGCGYGATARRLAAVRGARVTGLTLSCAQLAHAEARGTGGNPDYRLESWLETHLPDACCDVVVAIESFSHMADRERAFAQARRVLRPRGRLVVLDWLAAPAPRGLARRHLLTPICREGHLSGLDTLARSAERARRAGLEVRRTEDLTRRVRGTWPRALARVARRALVDPGLRRALRDPDQIDRGFPRTMARLALASWTGDFRYGLLSATRP